MRTSVGKICIAFAAVFFVLTVSCAWASESARVLKTGIRFDDVARPGVVGMDIFVRRNDYPSVLNVLSGMPASYAGLTSGDRILAINDIPTRGKSMREIDAIISDQPGARVSFIIRRGPLVKRYGVTVQAM